MKAGILGRFFETLKKLRHERKMIVKIDYEKSGIYMPEVGLSHRISLSSAVIFLSETFSMTVLANPLIMQMTLHS